MRPVFLILLSVARIRGELVKISITIDVFKCASGEVVPKIPIFLYKNYSFPNAYIGTERVGGNVHGATFWTKLASTLSGPTGLVHLEAEEEVYFPRIVWPILFFHLARKQIRSYSLRFSTVGAQTFSISALLATENHISSKFTKYCSPSSKMIQMHRLSESNRLPGLRASKRGSLGKLYGAFKSHLQMHFQGGWNYRMTSKSKGLSFHEHQYRMRVQNYAISQVERSISLQVLIGISNEENVDCNVDYYYPPTTTNCDPPLTNRAG
uniref:Uncharacterized protein n=1 Tax=Pristionchus pacificus TaxID=54126 RepID=A0A8R1YNP5_PRIPA